MEVRLIKHSAFLLLSLFSGAAYAYGEDVCTINGDEPAIVMSQTAFEADERMIAIVRTRALTPLDWRLLDEAGRVVMSGQSEVFGPDADSGDPVHWIDFSGVSDVGTGFRIEACGQQSRRFVIEDNPYGQMMADAFQYFYMNRLAEPQEPAYLPAPEYQRAAGFTQMVLTCFSGEDRWGTDWPGCDYALDVTGGWADAGDYGQYTVNGGISVWTLQHAYERLADRGELETAGWQEGPTTIPESGNGVSDLLDEARIHLEFMLAMQIPDGARVWAVAHQGEAPESGVPLAVFEIEDAGGLVHHKTHERAWLPLPQLPEDAEADRYLFPPSTAGTLNLAAVAAQCARLWRHLDQAFSEVCRSAAVRAYEAALRFPDLYAHNNFDGGGPYGDPDVSDEFAWAATELYLTTGEEAYREEAERWIESLAENPTLNLYWGGVGILPALGLSVPMALESDGLADRARQVLVTLADSYLAMRQTNGYRLPTTPDIYSWGSNGNFANRAIVLGAAHDLTGRHDYRNAMIDILDYLTGRNALDQSYVAGHGERAMQYAHHRFWAAGADEEYPIAPPGALSGGANNRNMADSVAREMQGQCAAQRCWVDHVDAYALNEVAINWNAPFVWMLVYLHSTAIQPVRPEPD